MKRLENIINLTPKRDLRKEIWSWSLYLTPEETTLKQTDKFSIISLSATLKDTLRTELKSVAFCRECAR